MAEGAGPCIERVVESTSRLLRTEIPVLIDHWRTMFELDEALLNKYCGSIQVHIENLFKDIKDQVEEKKSRMAQKVEKIILEGHKLQRELGVDVSFSVSEDLPLSTMISLLSELQEKCQRMKRERMDKFEELKKQETPLCQLLGEKPFALDSPVPSLAVLTELSTRIKSLEELKNERLTRVQECKKTVKDMMTMLEVSPLTDLETDACQDTNGYRDLTPHYVSQLVELRINYEEKVRLEMEELNHLRAKLHKLWDLIEEDPEHRNAIISRLKGIGSSVKRELTQEIGRCEEIKRANLIPMIEKLRGQIQKAWTRLTYTEGQRRGFPAFYTEEFNDDVLALHEIELAHLNQAFEETKKILELARERQYLMARQNHLEAQALNPQRLKNRGGQLLKEEKERKDVEKKLPKIEKELEQELVTYYTQKAHPFLWHGTDLLKTIKDEQKPCLFHSSTRLLSGTRSVTSSSTDSIASYSQFQEQMELGSGHRTPSRRCTPKPSNKFSTPKPSIQTSTPSMTRSASRLPLRIIQPSPYARAHSSPTTPKRLNAFKQSPRRVTPRKFAFSTFKNSLHF